LTFAIVFEFLTVATNAAAAKIESGKCGAVINL